MRTAKLLLPWKNTTVIGHLVNQWQDLGSAQTIIVCRSGNEALQNELDLLTNFALKRVFNPDADRGMFSSIQCAAASDGMISGLSHVVLTLGDQPHLARSTLKALLEHAQQNQKNICQPLYNGRRKHPVIFPVDIFITLAKSTASNLKEFLEQHASILSPLEINDASLDLDLDFPEDYDRARKSYENRE